jgi:hypothetical protein
MERQHYASPMGLNGREADEMSRQKEAGSQAHVSAQGAARQC